MLTYGIGFLSVGKGIFSVYMSVRTYVYPVNNSSIALRYIQDTYIHRVFPVNYTYTDIPCRTVRVCISSSHHLVTIHPIPIRTNPLIIQLWNNVPRAITMPHMLQKPTPRVRLALHAQQYSRRRHSLWHYTPLHFAVELFEAESFQGSIAPAAPDAAFDLLLAPFAIAITNAIAIDRAIDKVVDAPDRASASLSAPRHIGKWHGCHAAEIVGPCVSWLWRVEGSASIAWSGASCSHLVARLVPMVRDSSAIHLVN